MAFVFFIRQPAGYSLDASRSSVIADGHLAVLDDNRHFSHAVRVEQHFVQIGLVRQHVDKLRVRVRIQRPLGVRSCSLPVNNHFRHDSFLLRLPMQYPLIIDSVYGTCAN